jgi:hypothetical protein
MNGSSIRLWPSRRQGGPNDWCFSSYALFRGLRRQKLLEIDAMEKLRWTPQWQHREVQKARIPEGIGPLFYLEETQGTQRVHGHPGWVPWP